MRSGAAVLLVGALVSFAACSSDADQLDRSATERTIEKVIEADLPQAVDGVNCPKRIPQGEGKTVRCQVALVDVAGAVGIDVEQVADNELDITLLDAVIDPEAVGDELEQQLLATYLRPFTADCGKPGARVLAPGSTLPCTVSDDDGRRDATATIDDAAGTLRFSVADAPEPSPAPEPPDPPADPNGPAASFAPAPDPATDARPEPPVDVTGAD